jgi:hypothetical protein
MLGMLVVLKIHRIRVTLCSVSLMQTLALSRSYFEFKFGTTRFLQMNLLLLITGKCIWSFNCISLDSSLLYNSFDFSRRSCLNCLSALPESRFDTRSLSTALSLILD